MFQIAEMASSRTVLNLEDTSRTKNRGLSLDKVWPWPWPRRLGLCCLASIHQSHHHLRMLMTTLQVLTLERVLQTSHRWRGHAHHSSLPTAVDAQLQQLHLLQLVLRSRLPCWSIWNWQRSKCHHQRSSVIRGCRWRLKLQSRYCSHFWKKLCRFRQHWRQWSVSSVRADWSYAPTTLLALAWPRPGLALALASSMMASNPSLLYSKYLSLRM